jgi:hypothetical protein
MHDYTNMYNLLAVILINILAEDFSVERFIDELNMWNLCQRGPSSANIEYLYWLKYDELNYSNKL